MKATLGERGQVVIPKPLRDSMGLRPGQQLELVETDGRIIVTKTAPDDDPIESVRGAIRLPEGWDTNRWFEEVRGRPINTDPG
ncbi:MAG: AbrB/MazE/SpoVT family DNA-binding domain-containing protein [Chloroflexi bacterium]|nr:AbrB/MazE/SpoVT family DNA-binding domain-containing protein [Chloroflexota bacterium]